MEGSEDEEDKLENGTREERETEGEEEKEEVLKCYWIVDMKYERGKATVLLYVTFMCVCACIRPYAHVHTVPYVCILIRALR